MPYQRKILTVVLLSAGCGASSSRTPAPTPTPSRLPVPDIAAAPDNTVPQPVAALQLVSSPAVAPPATPPAIKSDDTQPENMLRLRSDLYRASELELNVAHAKFRALCDENGYPVVGNVASKSMRHDVSSYCQEVRTQLVMRGDS